MLCVFRAILCIFVIDLDHHKEIKSIEEITDIALESFPIEDYVEQLDPSDAKPESKHTSKPLAQSNSKHAFPFGAQISTPCTYGVF